MLASIESAVCGGTVNLCRALRRCLIHQHKYAAGGFEVLVSSSCVVCGLQSTTMMMKISSLRISWYLPALVLLVVFVCSSAWRGASFPAFKKSQRGIPFKQKRHLEGNISRCSGGSSKCQPLGKDAWWQHPSVLTSERLGLWQTSFLGLTGGASSAENATLLQHWWRCCPVSDGQIDLRGVGSAYSAVDSNWLMQLVPWGVDDHWAGLNITDITVNRTWQLQQSPVPTHSINVWHAEALNLPSTSSYSIRPSSSLSKHSHDWDASQCKLSPEVFRPGSIWTVVTQAADYQIDLYAKLLVQHTSYHQAVGFSGTILVLSRQMAAKLTEQREVQKGLDDGSFVIIIWGGDMVPSMPYYYQYLMYNMALLATWGVTDIKLAMIDLDEFLIVPTHLTFTAALKPGGCLHGYQHIRMLRVNGYFGITAAEASACYWATKAAESSNDATVKLNITDCGSPCELTDNSKLNRCKEIESNFTPDIQGLTDMGWQNYFRQQEQQRQGKQEPPHSVLQVRRQQFEVQQQQGTGDWQLPVGYVDKHLATAPSFRYAHKSMVDPNYVAAYAVHEASVVLLGGKDTKSGVKFECVFGIHLLNMFRHRWFGAGQQLVLYGNETFSLPEHIQQVLQLHQRI